MTDERLILVDSETHQEAGQAELDGQDVVFPDSIHGWSDVMDCRHAPYTDQSIDENCEVAHHVRKPFILVSADQFDSDDAEE